MKFPPVLLSPRRFNEDETQERMKVTRNRKNNQTKQTLEENEEI
jgi:hypothetical protein